MTFEAVPGEPLGPKFPTSLDASTVERMIGLVDRLAPYNPRRRWLRRLDVDRRLARHVAAGIVDAGDAEAVRGLGSSVKHRFAHGDITARNVLRDDRGELVLIDWEWAGSYPAGYERAFLWFSLAEVPGARAAVEGSVPARDEAGFLLSAVLIQLLHLHMWLDRPPMPFIDLHVDTLRALLTSVRGTGPG